MRIAVTGKHGQVAQSLIEYCAASQTKILPLSRPEVDLLNPKTIETALTSLRPDAVINAAAYTAVDLAESETTLANAVNAAGAGAVAWAAAKLGIPVVHISTDYVFDGSLDRPYREEDDTAPIGAYGRSKLAGERAVAEANPNHAILRTAWVYSPFGKNFVRTMLTLASKRDEISVVSDQLGTPSCALDLADGILKVTRNLLSQPDAPALRGVFHMTNAGETNWAEFAKVIFAASETICGPSARVNPIPASAYPTPARRPANSRLDNARLSEIHGVRLPEWHQSLSSCVRRLVEIDFLQKD